MKQLNKLMPTLEGDPIGEEVFEMPIQKGNDSVLKGHLEDSLPIQLGLEQGTYEGHAVRIN